MRRTGICVYFCVCKHACMRTPSLAGAVVRMVAGAWLPKLLQHGFQLTNYTYRESGSISRHVICTHIHGYHLDSRCRYNDWCLDTGSQTCMYHRARSCVSLFP